jgi:hypothetical protein
VLSADAEKKSQVIQAFVDLASAKPVIQQRFRPPAADDKKADPKADDKKVETPEKKP